MMPCTKVKHSDICNALAHAIVMARKGLARGGKMRVYFCDECEAYHFCHVKRRPKPKQTQPERGCENELATD